MLNIHQIPVLTDNYIYLLHCTSTNKTAVVDPANSTSVIAALDALNTSLDYIINTHHHLDHVGGNLELKKRYQCKIVGSASDSKRIPGIDILVSDRDLFNLGEHSAVVFEVPGHTVGHISFWFEKAQALFCGDTLFSLGCGRLFEGSAEQMWQSLSRLKALPNSTNIYCAHEYTEANGAFAEYIEPNNLELKKYMEIIRSKRQAGEPTIPSRLETEKKCNPFLRADKINLQEAAIHPLAPIQTFSKIRKMKDSF